MNFEEIYRIVFMAVRAYAHFFLDKDDSWLPTDNTDFQKELNFDEGHCIAFTLHLEEALGMRLGPRFKMERMSKVSELVIWIWHREIAKAKMQKGG